MLGVYLISILLVLCTSIFLYFKNSFNYWKKRGVPYLPPTFPYGNMRETNKHISEVLTNYYNTMKSRGYKFAGFYVFSEPNLVVLDKDLTRNILSKDFHHFMNRGLFFNERDDPLTGHLLTLENDDWRNLRTKLTPTFTSGKIKTMFQTVVDCSYPLIEVINKKATERSPIDIKENLARYTTDIIGSCAFGIDCNSFNAEESEFRKCGRRAFERNFVDHIKFLFVQNFPNLARFLHMKLIKPEVSDFFKGLVEKTVNYRELNNYERKDFMQLLIELKNGVDSHGKPLSDNLSFNRLAANAFVFFLAGFETSSTTMTYCLYLLAKYTDIQDKVRDEIREVISKYNNSITYEGVNEMKYLGQVINETLRLYPPVTVLARKCTVNYKIPDTDVIIEKGTRISIPTYAFQKDPELYPDPEKFDPDRFSEENKHSIPPYTFMPFGEGPRNCIGLRFGLVQTKVGIISVLKDFKITLNAKTPQMLSILPQNVILTSAETIYLDVEKA